MRFRFTVRMQSNASADEALKAASRTFYIPISRLPAGLKEAVSSAYLCMRAIDELEDHPDLDAGVKIEALHCISRNLQAGTGKSTSAGFSAGLAQLSAPLPDVSLRIGDWIETAPREIAPRICDASAAMADRMAWWVQNNWRIESERDLDHYTFSVAGAVGLLLSDLWSWFDGTKTDRLLAVGFGRGLQAVNIARNHKEDALRGVCFMPPGWTPREIHRYARENLALADAYMESLPKGPARTFCNLPLILAHATLNVLDKGREKLSREEVEALTEQAG
jgi:farnesyl-diphosphate farnesyltransferase